MRFLYFLVECPLSAWPLQWQEKSIYLWYICNSDMKDIFINARTQKFPINFGDL